MSISSFDHVAIPINKVDGMLSFYRSLGFVVEKMDRAIYVVKFGDNKIHLHLPELWKSDKFDLRGPSSLPGCGDFCFVWKGTIDGILSLLNENKVVVIEGPVNRIGGRSHGRDIGRSVYVRDPDMNLLEFIVYE